MSKNGYDQVDGKTNGLGENIYFKNQPNPSSFDYFDYDQKPRSASNISSTQQFGQIEAANQIQASRRPETGYDIKKNQNQNHPMDRNGVNDSLIRENPSSSKVKEITQNSCEQYKRHSCDSPKKDTSNFEGASQNKFPEYSSSSGQKSSSNRLNDDSVRKPKSTVQLENPKPQIDFVKDQQEIKDLQGVLDGMKTVSKEHFSYENQDALISDKDMVTPIQSYLDTKQILDSMSNSREEGQDDPLMYSFARKDSSADHLKGVKSLINKFSNENKQPKQKNMQNTNIFKDIINGNIVKQTEQWIPLYSPTSNKKSGKSSRSGSKNLGKRVKTQDELNQEKHQKVDEDSQIKSSLVIQIDSSNNLAENIGNDDSGVNSGLTCQEKLGSSEPLKIFEQLQMAEDKKQNAKLLKASIGISNSRSKREVKKLTPYDNSEYVLDDEPIEKTTKKGNQDGEAQVTKVTRNRSSTANFSNGQKLTPAQQVKFQKISDANDPFVLMYKHIMEPIIHFDKLELLQGDKQDFEILLKAKDLKSLPKDRKEEMLIQRVHVEFPDEGMLINCDLDPDFQRHTQQSQLASTQNLDSIGSNQRENDGEENDSSPLQPSSANTEEKQLEEPDQDNKEEMEVDETADKFKKPLNKKRGRKKQSLQTRKSTNSKWYNNCLPHYISECTWVDNTESNIQLMDEKNKKVKAEREKKRVESKAQENQQIEKMLELERQQQQYIQDVKDKDIESENKLESGEIKKEEAAVNVIQNKDQSIDNDEIIKAIEDFPEVKKEQAPPTEDEGKVQEPKYIIRENLKSIDQVLDKWRHCHYHSLDRLLDDLQQLVQNTLNKRCKNQLAKIYLTNFMINAQRVVKTKKKEFQEKWVNFYNIRLSNNQLNNCIVGHGNDNVWYKKFDQSTKREYFEIKNYKTKIPGEVELTQSEHEGFLNDGIDPNSDENKKYTQKELKEIERVTDILTTQKESKCCGDCCTKNPDDDKIVQTPTPVQNGNGAYPNFYEQPKCECVKLKSECGPDCGCDPEQCTNRQISMKQSLKFDLDVEERVTWGIDICTAVNFLTICPRDLPRPIQSNFIEKKLIYAVQQQNEQGYDVLKALKYIIDADLSDEIMKQKFNKQDQEIAAIMYDAIKNLPSKNSYHFRVHTKGIGIFCKKKQGIKKDSLVVEYFGEIYRPWHWFEKQDVIKQGQNANKLPKDLPEFYNILFERHMDDPKGYNIMTVDPIIHGNYASRLSHSCVANCQTINKVIQQNGNYSIGMFTNKDILYGEELCFDYCSFTESEKEYEEAICLCGTEYCKGRYLNLANDKKNLAIMKNNHTFIDRNYILFKAVTQSKLTIQDKQRLYQNGLRSSSLDVAPEWLQKWASLICEYLEFEEIIYPEFFKNDFPGYQLNDIKLEAKMQKETQIQNIAITIDKIMHVLESMNTREPPVRALTFEERYMRLWEESNSVKENVIDTIHKIEDCAQREQALIMLRDCDTSSATLKAFWPEINENETETLFKAKYEKVRKVLADVSAILRSVNSQLVAVPAFCDILMMYANTETYFTQNELYKKSKSDEVVIRKCDVRQGEGASMDKYSQGRQAYKGCKEYDSQYIWGQLVVWYKQTVDKPNASLSADRRGTLSIPDVQCFVVNPNKVSFESPSSGQQVKKRNRGKKNRESSQEIMPVQGSKSRGVKPAMDSQAEIQPSDQPIATSLQIECKTEPEQPKHMKIVYPSKRHQKREDFLQNWKETFSKQWDVCCAWSFQNKKKMYGSIQFESVLRTDKMVQEKFIISEDMTSEEKQRIFQEKYQFFMEHRLEYFDDIVKQLLKY